MAVYTKMALSFAINCRHIAVGSTLPGGTPMHVGVAGTNAFDEVWLYAVNNYGSNINGTVWWGGSSPSDFAIIPVGTAIGRVLLIDGGLINNNGTVGVSCTQNGTNGLVCDGFVNRITP